MRKPYSEFEISQLVYDTAEVCEKPYRLFAAFALNALCDVADVDKIDELWGTEIPKAILDKIVAGIVREYCECFSTNERIEVFGKYYKPQYPNAFDRKALCQIFDFKTKGDYYIIEKTGIMDLESRDTTAYEKSKAELEENRNYFRKIVYVADGRPDGKDILTDMEMAYYCWGLYCFRTRSYNEKEWYGKYGKYIFQPLDEIRKCWTDDCKIKGYPNGVFAFSANAIRQWNEQHGQASVIDNIGVGQANGFWFNTATQTKFMY